MIDEIRISKRQLIALRGAKCEICGITEWCGKPITFDDHHCDRNRKNEKESNRKIICPNCHRQQHLERSEESKRKNSIAHTGKRYSDETKLKQSRARRGPRNGLYGRTGELSHLFGKHLSEETKQKIRVTKLGEKNPMYRKHFSEEVKQKRSIKFSDGRNKGQNNPNSRTNRAKRMLQSGATL